LPENALQPGISIQIFSLMDFYPFALIRRHGSPFAFGPLFGCLLLCFGFAHLGHTQTSVDSLPTVVDYSDPKEYEIGGIEVTGAEFTDVNALKSISGLRVGDKIRVPSDEIPNALKSLWKLRLFDNVEILQQKTIGDIVFLEIHVTERPRLSRHTFRGVKKSYHDDLNDEVNRFLLKGAIVTQNVKTNAAVAIQEYFREKGYLDTEVKVTEEKDERATNSVILIFDIARNDRVKIRDITFLGNETIPDKKLRGKMKGTRRKKRLLSNSRFLREKYTEDQEAVIAFYNTQGYRDARIIGDSIWRDEKGELHIDVRIDEGNQYYFGNISWKGNSIYDSTALSNVLAIGRGDIYNQELLDTRLQFSMDGRDVSSLYMDNGYLFFTVDPVEVAVAEDTINIEMRIFEGPQANIDRVIIRGNDRTHEHVARRELRTLPGAKFSRSDIIRSQRELINLGYFNPEALGINTPVNPQRGTVDIEYTVEEKPSDQLELSAGWGGRGNGVIGTLGVSFNNFSIRNIFRKEAWKPLPQGDGQRLSLRAQTNGRFFQSYNASFTEPWLGGKRPTSFSVGGSLTRFTNGFDKNSVNFGEFSILNFFVGIGTRLKWPDDNFISNTTVNIQNITLNNYGTIFTTDDGVNVQRGEYKNFNLQQTFTRTTVVDPIFPKRGSRFALTIQLTPPYSLFRQDNFWALSEGDRQAVLNQENDQLLLLNPNAEPYTFSSPFIQNRIQQEEIARRFDFLEYHKWRFDAQWYAPIVGNLVLKAEAKIGLLGAYDNEIGVSPFEQFQLGGDGLANQQVGLTGVDIISMRGYETNDINNNQAATVFNKYTLELRYPLSLNPNATIFVHTFLQGGNAWDGFRNFNPFDMRRSGGLGLRVFLPMFGTLGFDYGIGFDKPQLVNQGARWSEFGQFNIVLGFEPE
jgi:outer membrane protein insertion porin family